MNAAPLHTWDVTPVEATAIQQNLRRAVVCQNELGTVRRVAGVDVGFDKAAGLARAAVVSLSYPGLEVLESAVMQQPVCFPYVPGLLSFRELPVILQALQQLRQPPWPLCWLAPRATACPRQPAGRTAWLRKQHKTEVSREP